MKTYGLLGKELKHSFSKDYFTRKFEAEGIEAEYLNFELQSLDELGSVFNRTGGIHGLNVTIPYKETIISYLDEIHPEAREIGAVNTIRFSEGKRIGYNTDHIGFSKSLRPFLAHGMEKALILGTGGAAKAVKYVLNKLGISTLQVSRNPSGGGHLAYSDLNENAIAFHKIIVNTTPLGTWPQVDEKPEIPYAGIGRGHLVYDLIYNPEETAFLKEAKSRGAIILNGLDMLKIQAEESWKIWGEYEV
jgi:shikimate dehydrogenase